MKFDGFSAVLEKKQEMAQQRQHNAEKQFQFALGLFHQAQAQDFQNKDLLNQCTDALFEAIRIHRTHPEPLVTLGYVLILLDLQKLALKYLKRALELSPGHPDAQELIEYLLKPTPSQPTPTVGSESLEPPRVETIDYDQLYQDTEKQILAYMHHISTDVRPTLASNQDDCLSLKSNLESFQEELSELQDKLDQLDQEMDIAQLEMKLHPINVYIRQLSKLLKDSQTACTLVKNIRKTHASFHQTIEKQTALAPHELEHILDTMDLYADQLDELDESGHDTDSIVRLYEALMDDVEDYQDQLDEA